MGSEMCIRDRDIDTETVLLEDRYIFCRKIRRTILAQRKTKGTRGLCHICHLGHGHRQAKEVRVVTAQFMGQETVFSIHIFSDTWLVPSSHPRLIPGETSAGIAPAGREGREVIRAIRVEYCGLKTTRRNTMMSIVPCSGRNRATVCGPSRECTSGDVGATAGEPSPEGILCIF